MIMLKSGRSLPVSDDFDVFFRDLMDGVINEALMNVHEQEENEKMDDNQRQQLLLKEIMDNCILVSHQVLQISKENESLSKFLVTGSLFQCAVMTFQHSGYQPDNEDHDKGSGDDDTLH